MALELSDDRCANCDACDDFVPCHHCGMCRRCGVGHGSVTMWDSWGDWNEPRSGRLDDPSDDDGDTYG